MRSLTVFNPRASEHKHRRPGTNQTASRVPIGSVRWNFNVHATFLELTFRSLSRCYHHLREPRRMLFNQCELEIQNLLTSAGHWLSDYSYSPSLHSSLRLSLQRWVLCTNQSHLQLAVSLVCPNQFRVSTAILSIVSGSKTFKSIAFNSHLY